MLRDINALGTQYLRFPNEVESTSRADLLLGFAVNLHDSNLQLTFEQACNCASVYASLPVVRGNPDQTFRATWWQRQWALFIAAVFSPITTLYLATKENQKIILRSKNLQ
jgi:hypothetical protein